MADSSGDKSGRFDPEEIFDRVFSMERYRKQLENLALENKRSIEVRMVDISKYSQRLADLILEHPDEYIGYAEKAALNRLRVETPNMPMSYPMTLRG